MRAPNHNGRHGPTISAQQGALILKRLERIEAGMRAETRAAERRTRRLLKVLERIANAIERRPA
jgi:hypothetical protein